MSALGMITTVMATELAEAIQLDIRDGWKPDTMSSLLGTFGPAVSAWLKTTAQSFVDQDASVQKVCRGREHPGCNYLATCGTTCLKCGSKV